MKKNSLLFLALASLVMLATSCKNVFENKSNNSNDNTGNICIRLPKSNNGNAARIAADAKYKIMVVKIDQKPDETVVIDDPIEFLKPYTVSETDEPSENIVFDETRSAGEVVQIEELEVGYYAVYCKAEDDSKHYYEGLSIAEVIADETAESKVILKKHMYPITLASKDYLNSNDDTVFLRYITIDTDENTKFEGNDIFSIKMEGTSSEEILVAGFALGVELEIPDEETDSNFVELFNFSNFNMVDVNLQKDGKFKLEQTVKIEEDYSYDVLIKEYQEAFNTEDVPVLKMMMLYYPEYCDKEVKLTDVTYKISKVAEEIPAVRTNYRFSKKYTNGAEFPVTLPEGFAINHFQNIKVTLTGEASMKTENLGMEFNQKSEDRGYFSTDIVNIAVEQGAFTKEVVLDTSNFCTNGKILSSGIRLMYEYNNKEADPELPDEVLEIKNLSYKIEVLEPKATFTKTEKDTRDYSVKTLVPELIGGKKGEMYKLTLTGTSNKNIPVLKASFDNSYYSYSNSSIALPKRRDANFVAGTEGKYEVTFVLETDVSDEYYSSIPCLTLSYQSEYLDEDAEFTGIKITIEKTTEKINSTVNNAKFYPNPYNNNNGYLFFEEFYKNQFEWKENYEYMFTVVGKPSMDVSNLRCQVVGFESYNNENIPYEISDPSDAFELKAGQEFEYTFKVIVTKPVYQQVILTYIAFYYSSDSEDILTINDFKIISTDSKEIKKEPPVSKSLASDEYMQFEETAEGLKITVLPSSLSNLEIIQAPEWYSFVVDSDELGGNGFSIIWPFEFVSGKDNTKFIIQANDPTKENTWVYREYKLIMDGYYNKDVFDPKYFYGGAATYKLNNADVCIGVKKELTNGTLDEALKNFTFNGNESLCSERYLKYSIQTVKEIKDGQWLNNYVIELTFDINDTEIFNKLYNTEVSFGYNTITSLLSGKTFYGVSGTELTKFWTKLIENEYRINCSGDYSFRTYGAQEYGEFRIPIWGDTEIYTLK